MADLRGVRFTFDDTSHDEIFIGNVRLSSLGGGPGVLAAATGIASTDDPIDDRASRTADVNQVSAIRRAAGAATDATVEIELTSNREFLPRGELLVLRIGGQETSLSRYTDGGDTRRVIFTLTAQQFALIATGDAMSVRYGTDAARAEWNFGRIDKSVLR